jgi:hypothetical protein
MEPCINSLRTQIIESENLCLLLVGKALFIQGFWGASEEVPLTRDMTVTRDATAERERRGIYTQETCLYGKGALGILVTV